MERSASVRLLRNFFPKMKITPTNIHHFRVCTIDGTLYRCAKYPQPPPPSPTQKMVTLVYITFNIYFQMHNEAQKQAYYPFSKIFKIQTIMDKSPWDSLNVTSILCVSQVLSQKAVLSFYKSMSPPPSPPNTMLKDQRNCALTVSTLSVGWG